MEDEKIIQLYWERKEEALKLTNEKYGAYCYSIAQQILQDEKYSQECVNDALLAAWLSIPPKRPASLQKYLGEITTKIAKEFAVGRCQKKQKQRSKKQQKPGKTYRKTRVGMCIYKINRCFKYVPVAACICIVFFAALYIVNHMNLNLNRSQTDFFLSASESSDKSELSLQGETVSDFEYGVETNGDDALEHTDQNEDKPDPVMPVRFDSYEGPALAMTATGDTQNVKTSRKLQAKVTSQYYNGIAQPLLHIYDRYQIQNTSREDKTLQLVYPFVTTMNLSYGLDDSILKVQGEEKQKIEYGIGDGISTSLGGKPNEGTTLEEYIKLLDIHSEYQENALRKAVDWNQEVSVYFFTDIQIDDGSGGVIGVTVTGQDADVLTYGFDYAASSGIEDDDMANYCFFAPTEYARPMLIVTGQQTAEPKLGYYTNLDCEDEVEGIQCTMQKRQMLYADALHLCSREAARKMIYAYDNQQYTGRLPKYFNEDAVYQALTVISAEDEFYDTLVQRYETIELEEILKIMFYETRIVYAMVTVTIPAEKTVRVTAQVQKRQIYGNFTLAEDDESQKTSYQYDFVSAQNSRLNVKKTNFRLDEPEIWKVMVDDMGLKQNGSRLSASFQKGNYSFIISSKR